MQDAAHDEQLPQPAPGRRWGLRRDLAIAAVVLIGVALITNAIAHERDEPRDAAPASASGNVPDTGRATFTPSGGAQLPRTAAQATRCPPHSRCVTVKQVSAPARAAIEEAFPGATLITAETVRVNSADVGQHALWRMRVEARAGAAEIRVHLRGIAQSDEQRSDVVRLGGQAITRYEDALLQFHVLIEVITPADERQPIEPIERLADDVRLLAEV